MILFQEVIASGGGGRNYSYALKNYIIFYENKGLRIGGSLSLR